MGAAGCTSGHGTLLPASGPHPQSQEAAKYKVQIKPVHNKDQQQWNMVAFSSLMRSLGECLTIHSPPVLFFFFK